MSDRTVAQMIEQAQRWRADAEARNNMSALTAPWYVTAGEARALRDELGCYQVGEPQSPTFMGLPLKVIEE